MSRNTCFLVSSNLVSGIRCEIDVADLSVRLTESLQVPLATLLAIKNLAVFDRENPANRFRIADRLVSFECDFAQRVLIAFFNRYRDVHWALPGFPEISGIWKPLVTGIVDCGLGVLHENF